MNRLLVGFVTVGIVVLACGKKDNPGSSDEISGAYVREYSFKVVHPDTGAEIGMRTIRDTIFIVSIHEKFEVSNHKWAKNDYENAGWRNMEHADDRPFEMILSCFDGKDSTFKVGHQSVLQLHSDKHGVYISRPDGNRYQKTEGNF